MDMGLFDRPLYNENKRLKKENQELKEEKELSKNWLMLEVIDSFMEENDLYDKFIRYAKTYGLKYKEKNKLVDIYKEL